MKTQFIGSVESQGGDVVYGWVTDQISPTAPVAIDVVHQGQVVDRFIADNKKDVSSANGTSESAQRFEYRPGNDLMNLQLSYVPTGSVKPLVGPDEQIGATTGEDDSLFIDGFLEHVGTGRVSGWVKYAIRPDVAVKLNIFSDGKLLGEGIANLFRADLAEAFETSGFHAFDIAISHAPREGSIVEVRPFGSLRSLPGIGAASEAAISPIEAFAGSLDTVEGGVAAGWAYDPANPDEPCEVEFLVNDVVVGITKASLFREDVKAAGFGNGVAGFRAELDVNIYDSDKVLVRARVKTAE